ncbi:MAG: DsbA family protein [Candidatus Omnitrophica bacterium]|nr:DsbA family protein [Candidatus Omnitrophota bacterium]
MVSSRRSLWCFLLSLLGLGLCAYLALVHFALLRGELLGGMACGGPGSGPFNCHAVTAGRHGFFAGVPLWVWGTIGYLAAAHLALLAKSVPDVAPQAMTALAALALAFVLVDAVLLIVMLTQVKYLCLFCLLTYATNLALLLTARWAVGQPWRALLRGAGPALQALLPGPRRPLAWILWGGTALAAFGVVAAHAAATYVSHGAPGLVKRQVSEFVLKEQRVHVEAGASPSKGPAQAPVTVVEFSDFFCPACQKASKFNTIMLAGRTDARIVFKHFPLDTACNEAVNRMVHPGACAVAAAAACAHQQGKFWPLHDRIFLKGHDYQPAQLRADAHQVGLHLEQFDRCVASGEGMEAVRRDIAEGQRLGVVSTPTYFVNGLKMPGLLGPAVFEALVDLLKNESSS